jgi:hypothetical protein
MDSGKLNTDLTMTGADEFVEFQPILSERDDYMVIEYPGFVGNLDTVLSTLGGLKEIEQVNPIILNHQLTYKKNTTTVGGGRE